MVQQSSSGINIQRKEEGINLISSPATSKQHLAPLLKLTVIPELGHGQRQALCAWHWFQILGALSQTIDSNLRLKLILTSTEPGIARLGRGATHMAHELTCLVHELDWVSSIVDVGVVDEVGGINLAEEAIVGEPHNAVIEPDTAVEGIGRAELGEGSGGGVNAGGAVLGVNIAAALGESVEWDRKN